MSKIEIRLDAKEIFDHIDDMLAWQAIASEPQTLRFHQPHFMRAEPLVRLGRNLHGLLTPHSLECEEEPAASTPSENRQENHDWSSWIAQVMPEFMARKEFAGKHHAVMVEHEPQDEVPANETGVQSGSITGDSVSDLITQDEGGYHGLRYHLWSIGEFNEKERRHIVGSYKLPQVARVFQTQDVFAFVDGRASSGNYTFGYWAGEFHGLNKRPLRGGLKEQGFGDFHPAFLKLGELMSAVVARQELWNVELSLGKKRTGVALQTDALGAREMVNMLRAGDTATGRRKSLVHWVDEHMRRKNRLDAEATVKVNAHLRGVHGIEAGRYYARIWPATNVLIGAANGARFDREARPA